MRVLGIDPGVTGAFAVVEGSVVDSANRVIIEILDAPWEFEKKGSAKKRVNLPLYVDMLRGLIERTDPDLAVVELITGRTVRGTVATCKLCGSFVAAQVLAIACDIPYTTPPAAYWKKSFSLLRSTKLASRILVRRLYPDYSHNLYSYIDNKAVDRAEAVLLATYGVIHAAAINKRSALNIGS